MPLRKDLSIWETFIEITQRRNLFAHNDGIVSTQYLNACKVNSVTHEDNKINIGAELGIDIDYFNKAFNCLF